ncbi:MAG: hypothetical protein MMC33_001749 [Icmadophila ericetorum]|nr:hypothetical protein [Icmadophila ericetorum]
MGGQQPFLYDRASQYSFSGPTDKVFDPKAVSRASWTPTAPRPKQEGPLINAKELNKHPDSYVILPYGNINAKPMSPRTKNKVKYTRWMQLLLRFASLLGALGMLFCVICIKGTSTTLGWIIRIPPSVAILHTLYGIYHLFRASKARTPASTASYMIFAAIIDAGIIPFCVFTALIAQEQLPEPSYAPGRWQTLFNNDPDTFRILFATYILSIVNGGMHLTSLAISIYLATLFRKISKLPPDMNPLEDNLTSRHKRNKSSISTVLSDVSITKQDSHLSAPLMDPPRTVPFLQTRNDSNISLTTPYNRSTHASRTNLPSQIYQQPSSQRASQIYQEPRSARASRIFQEPPSQRSSHTILPRSDTDSPTKRSSYYTADSRPNSTRPTSAVSRPQSATPSITPSQASSNNWTSYPSPISSPEPPPSPHGDREPKLPTLIPEFQHLRPNSKKESSNYSFYKPLVFPNAENNENTNSVLPRPLEMNPPTPPVPSDNKVSFNNKRPLSSTVGTGNSKSNTGLRSFSFEASYPERNVGRPQKTTERPRQTPAPLPLSAAAVRRQSFGLGLEPAGSQKGPPLPLSSANVRRQSFGLALGLAGAGGANGKERFYGDLNAAAVIGGGREGRAEGRVVSSGRSLKGLSGLAIGKIRGRIVSGKGMEEGKGNGKSGAMYYG